MKKDKAKFINQIADDLPQIFEWKLEEEDFTGLELNLSGFGEKRRFDPLSMYRVEVPVMVAVEHKQQLKDAYKKAGDEGVRQYINAVYSRMQTAEYIN